MRNLPARHTNDRPKIAHIFARIILREVSLDFSPRGDLTTKAGLLTDLGDYACGLLSALPAVRTVNVVGSTALVALTPKVLEAINCHLSLVRVTIPSLSTKQNLYPLLTGVSSGKIYRKVFVSKVVMPFYSDEEMTSNAKERLLEVCQKISELGITVNDLHIYTTSQADQVDLGFVHRTTAIFKNLTGLTCELPLASEGNGAVYSFFAEHPTLLRLTTPIKNHFRDQTWIDKTPYFQALLEAILPPVNSLEVMLRRSSVADLFQLKGVYLTFDDSYLPHDMKIVLARISQACTDIDTLDLRNLYVRVNTGSLLQTEDVVSSVYFSSLGIFLNGPALYFQ